jgi:hypothetical protein
MRYKYKRYEFVRAAGNTQFSSRSQNVGGASANCYFIRIELP